MFSCNPLLRAKSFNFPDRCGLSIEIPVSLSIAREVFRDIQATKSDGTATPHVSVTLDGCRQETVNTSLPHSKDYHVGMTIMPFLMQSAISYAR